ncbi:hypothetical protein AZE42_01321 [Rhizopogon vesiculosus]|uniref:Uncharacterized protein n=1 Tax=Rhizopogon vesiculosus TaxID=180088 RepID=A0A1J8PZS9_9AGAM|nr:hypothetical protein AZE42_01321 [Rhizopogon vesiculosus]
MYTRSESQSERRTSSRGGYGHERSYREDLVLEQAQKLLLRQLLGQSIRDFERCTSFQGVDRGRTSFEPTGYFPAKEPIMIKKLSVLLQATVPANAVEPDTTVQSPSDTASSPSEHAQQASA